MVNIESTASQLLSGALSSANRPATVSQASPLLTTLPTQSATLPAPSTTLPAPSTTLPAPSTTLPAPSTTLPALPKTKTKKLARRGRKKPKNTTPAAHIASVLPPTPPEPAPRSEPPPYLPLELLEAVLVQRISNLHKAAQKLHGAAQAVFNHAGLSHRQSAQRTLKQKAKEIDTAFMDELATIVAVVPGIHIYQLIIHTPLVHVSGAGKKAADEAEEEEEAEKKGNVIELLNLHSIFKTRPEQKKCIITGTKQREELRKKLALAFGPAFERACQEGKVDVAQWWWAWYLDVTQNPTQFDKKPVVPARMSNDLMAAIAKNGHVAIFEWLRAADLFPLDYAEAVLDAAAGAGQVDILDWWYKYSRPDIAKADRLHFKYSHKAIGVASAYGHLNVMNWFLSKSLEQDPAKKLRIKKTARTQKWAKDQKWPEESIGWWREKGFML